MDNSRAVPKTRTDTSDVFFADAAFEALEPRKTLPAKFQRLLKRLNLKDRVKDKRVGIKMHFGGSNSYSTIPPVFIRLLVVALADAGASSVCVMDNDPADGLPRGYTQEVLGCEVISCFGPQKKGCGQVYRKLRVNL